ncbi:phage tail assembly chaperone [Mesorhizobium sp. CAU 1741]|uniref:phage tail assembly chaperone n=1 Tax=Mesorhizobium sp. CAU 1741 TaxID=3140366 RepID=UPI00325BDE13
MREPCRRLAGVDVRLGRAGHRGAVAPSNAVADKTRRFPWDETIAVGLGLLRLSPRDFWAMTPRELGHAMRILLPSDAPKRQALETLMAMFPDARRGEQK